MILLAPAILLAGSPPDVWTGVLILAAVLVGLACLAIVVRELWRSGRRAPGSPMTKDDDTRAVRGTGNQDD